MGSLGYTPLCFLKSAEVLENEWLAAGLILRVRKSLRIGSFWTGLRAFEAL